MQSLHAAADSAGLSVNFKLSDQAQDVARATGLFSPALALLQIAPELAALTGWKMRLMMLSYRRVPFLGICVGMQLMAEQGFEDGLSQGLGWIKGHVEKIEASDLKIPHMGWNSLNLKKIIPSSMDFKNGHAVYFCS